MQWPIDTSAFSFMGAYPPEPVFDRETWHQQADENGKPLYCMELMCFWKEGAEALTVRFPGTPSAGLGKGTPVRVTGLSISDSAVYAQQGLAFRAARVEPLDASGQPGGAA
jgi:hypothetical protein